MSKQMPIIFTHTHILRCLILHISTPDLTPLALCLSGIVNSDTEKLDIHHPIRPITKQRLYHLVLLGDSPQPLLDPKVDDLLLPSTKVLILYINNFIIVVTIVPPLIYCVVTIVPPLIYCVLI